MGGAPPGSKGVTRRPSGPVWAPAGPAPFFDLPVYQLGNSSCSSVLEQAPVSNRGSQQQRHTQEAKSLALSSLDLRGTGSLRSLPAPSIEIVPFHTFSFWCPLPPGSGLPWPPRGPGLTASPSLGSAPCPLPCQHPPSPVSRISQSESCKSGAEGRAGEQGLGESGGREGGSGEGSGTAGGRELVQKGLEGSVSSTHS